MDLHHPSYVEAIKFKYNPSCRKEAVRNSQEFVAKNILQASGTT